MQLPPILRVHSVMQTEAPPEPWEADAEDVTFVPLLREMIVAALRPGNELSALTLAVANVVVPPGSYSSESGGRSPAVGEYVAVTVSGPGAWATDDTWSPGADSPTSQLAALHQVLLRAGARYAYSRQLPASSSMTIFLPRLVSD